MSFVDQFLMSAGIINLTAGYAIAAVLAPFYFPGINLPIVFAIGTIPAIAQAVAYSKLSALIPRSGGDYIWSSRILGPFFGTTQMLFMYVTTFVSFNAFALWCALTLGLTPAFFALGVATHSASTFQIGTMLSQPWPLGFPVVLVLLLISSLLALVSLRVYTWIQKVVMVVVFLASIVFIVAQFMVPPASVPASFDSAMRLGGYNMTYEGVMQTAKAGGFPLGFNLNNTLLAAIPWGFFAFSGFNFGTYLAGETKNVKHSIFWALMLSCFVNAVGLVVMGLGSYYAFGADFLNAASYVAATTPSALPALPAPNTLLAFSNPWVAFFVDIVFVPSNLIVAAAYIITISRMLFAAAFDRLLPAAFANVNERFHTPHWPIVFTGLVSVVYATIFWNFSFASTWLNTSIVFPIGFLLPLVGIAAFPFVKKELFARSGGTSRDALILAISGVIGVACFVFYAFAETFPIISGVFLGASLTIAYVFLVAMLVVSAIVYLSAKARMKRSGLEMSKIYAEIPPE
jgi:amino acid transporter